jgi:hypothetical protein
MLGIRDIRRAIPYPPSFNKMAAKTIEPAIGASTCALGSHRCTENIGSFTRKPPINMIEQIELNLSSVGIINSVFIVIII